MLQKIQLRHPLTLTPIYINIYFSYFYLTSATEQLFNWNLEFPDYHQKLTIKPLVG